MRYLLDTDICIYAMTARRPAVVDAIRSHAADGIGLSAVSAAELAFGAAKSRSERNVDALRRFLSNLEVAAFDEAAAGLAGTLRAWLASQGTPIGPYDTLIAAHAHALGATLVTNNVREFARVPGLRVANWAEPER